jgi:hypothetical protein
MLPLLRRIVLDIRQSWEQIITKRTELEFHEKEDARRAEQAGAAESSGSGPSRTRSRVGDLKNDLNLLIERINSYIREVEDLGCYVEEFKRGIINFPSLYHGRKVFLCWGLEDDRVNSWHELDESYNDRVPIRDSSQFLNHNPKITGHG